MAVAFVTQDHLKLGPNDVLITNASRSAIQCGETNAKLLRTLLRKGVRLYDCADLHAKVMLFDNTAVVGSCNMSNSSANSLVEAAILTDHATTTANVASLLEQLKEQSVRLTAARIDKLCEIEVIRRGRGPSHRSVPRKTEVAELGNRTWIIGVRELVREPSSTEQEMIETAAARLEVDEDDLSWIRWSNRGRFVYETREGDSVIMIWRRHKATRPSFVWRSTAIRLKQRAKSWSMFYYQKRHGKNSEMPFSSFQRMLKRLGYPKRVGPTVTQALDAEIADAIERNWTKAASRG